MVGLIILLYILPLTFADNFLLHRTSDTFLQLIHLAWILLLTSSWSFRRRKICRRKIGRTEFSPYTTGTNSINGNMADYINLVQTAIGASNRTNSTGEYRLFGAGIVCDLPKKYDLPL